MIGTYRKTNTASASSLTRIIVGLFMLMFAFWQAHPASAQDTPKAEASPRVTITSVSTGAFPTIRMDLEAYDDQGRFLANLEAGDLRVLEDGRALQPALVKPVKNSFQISVVFSLNADMGYPTGDTTSYERIRAGLLKWFETGKEADTLSIATPTGLHLIGSANRDEWKAALGSYAPDFRAVQPGLASLEEALKRSPLESETSARRVVLLITPSIPKLNDDALTGVIEQAKQARARVFVWYLSGIEANSTDGHPLRQLTEQTGGQFTDLHAAYSIPIFGDQLTALRDGYQVEYTSSINKGGDHTLAVEVKSGGKAAASDPRPFQMNLLPPNPIFLSPPESIVRAARNAEGDAAALTPEEIDLQVMIEFPDALPREIRFSRLYVDEKLIDENSAQPFDRFTWDLRETKQSQTHNLRVEVVDMQGMVGSSIELPIGVEVESAAVEADPQPDTLARVSVSGVEIPQTALILGAIAVSGLILGGVLVVNARRRDPLMTRRTKPAVKKASGYAKNLTGFFDAAAHLRRKGTPAAANRGGVASPAVPARLVTLDDAEEPIPGGLIPLAEGEITFGSDPTRATQVLHSPSVSALHARLYRDSESRFVLADMGSVAGSWINYAPVSQGGARLEHGDLIHIGRRMFRFESLQPAETRAVEVKALHGEKKVRQGVGDLV